MTLRVREDVRLEDGRTATLDGRFSLASLVGVVFAAFALAGPPDAVAQESLAASCEPPREDTSSSSNLSGIGDVAYAQTFTSALGGALTRAQIDVTEISGTGNYLVRIWSVDGADVPAAVLAETTVADADVPVGDSVLEVVFASPAAVVAGEQYALSIARPDSTSLAVGVRSDDDCAHTLRFGSPSVGGFSSLGLDMVFRVFVTTPSVSDISSSDTPSSATPVVATASCNGHEATQVGTAGGDALAGTPGRDVIAGLGGSDEIDGLGGNDLICGGPGKDRLRGGKGNDRLLGQAGADMLKGGKGTDACRSGKGRDVEKSC